MTQERGRKLGLLSPALNGFAKERVFNVPGGVPTLRFTSNAVRVRIDLILLHVQIVQNGNDVSFA